MPAGKSKKAGVIALTFYTRLVPGSFSGYAVGPLILIRHEFRDDAGLHAHEETHVAQFWRRPFTHDLRYMVSRSYRQACEVEAYRAQLALAPWGLMKFADSLSKKYGLRLTEAEARQLLSESANASH